MNFLCFFLPIAAGRNLGLNFWILRNFDFFEFSCACKGQLPTFPPLSLSTIQRFGAKHKTQYSYQYWLGGFWLPVPGADEKGSNLKKIGRNCYPSFWVATFHLLARMRRVLRTIFRFREISIFSNSRVHAKVNFRVLP